ncbi:hypothetical protein MMASJCM_3485 [Mycobacteroides abscessus subsp. massiliense CCUG 48898 = JCM 15300]|nr:hypothetical protein MMASJCM_3485 [Mycobacteroides abscessus subsp. massiliense CCUG 48898 = JCM 15300]
MILTVVRALYVPPRAPETYSPSFHYPNSAQPVDRDRVIFQGVVTVEDLVQLLVVPHWTETEFRSNRLIFRSSSVPPNSFKIKHFGDFHGRSRSPIWSASHALSA